MLTKNETERLRQGILATIALPVIGAIEDYSWEAIFHYVKDIPLSDPASGRSKLLYDAVDPKTGTGWSLKSLQIKNNELVDVLAGVKTFSYVIQRADVIKKAIQLGFPYLTEQSPPNDIGAAIIKHWNEKITSSQAIQGVSNSYESILLKTLKGDEYIYCEFPLNELDPSIFSWHWTTRECIGLQGSIAGQTELVWYKNQKQLFRTRTLPSQRVHIKIKRTRLTLNRYVQTILSALSE